MANFFAELKRRHIYRVAAAYAVVAWIVLQIVNNVAPAFNLPGTAVMLVILLLSVGFPIALIFAWVLELKSPDAPTKTSTMDWVLVAVAITFVGMFAYQQFAPSRAIVTAQSGIEAARDAVANPAGISVAVLPFVNLSDDRQQEFFSDGMTEEITSALAKVQNLRVVGRTSAFQFKGENKDLRAIGQALSATHLIEGSVRKDGNEVRITAQLIKADDGTHLWTESYNRELKGVFALQEEIATAIANALRVPLGLKQGEALVSNRTNDTASYQDFLRARGLVRSRGLKALTDGAALLEQVVARDPGYAPAWAVLSQAYEATPNFHPAWLSGNVAEARHVVDESMPRAEAAAERAIRLDEKNADGYASLGYTQALRGKLLQAEDTFLKALSLDPNNPDALHQYSVMLSGAGRLRESLALRERLQSLEPFVPVYNLTSAHIFWLNGQSDMAVSLLRDVPANLVLSQIFLSRVYASLGRNDEAADKLLGVPGGTFAPGLVEGAVRLMRTPPAGGTPQSLPRLGYLDFAYLRAGAADRVLDFHEGNIEVGYSVGVPISALWHPYYAPARKGERFKAFLRKAGITDYWRAKGWPEFCHPTSGDDFVCD